MSNYPPNQAPTILPDPLHDGTREMHPAYGMIGASRVSSQPGAYLHGSDFRHGHFVMVTIHNSILWRSLSKDWINSGGREYIRVALSEAQWASFVSSMNVGDGVPCTVEHIEGTPVPGIDRTVDRRAQFRGELGDTLNDAVEGLTKALDTIGKLGVSAKVREELAGLVTKARQEITANTAFVADSFDKHVERSTERAKIEINAYLQGVIVRSGIGALRQGSSIELPAIAGEKIDA